MSRQTHHACALQVNRTGMLIIGASCSGKTSLMMGLLERAVADGFQNAMVADDRVYLTADESVVFAKVPDEISGMIEVSGYGIISRPYLEACRINLVIEVVEDETISRMPESQLHEVEGVSLPLLRVPKRHERQSVRIVFSWLEENGCLHVE